MSTTDLTAGAAASQQQQQQPAGDAPAEANDFRKNFNYPLIRVSIIE